MWDGILVLVLLLAAAWYLARRFRRQVKNPASGCGSCPQSCGCGSSCCSEDKG